MSKLANVSKHCEDILVLFIASKCYPQVSWQPAQRIRQSKIWDIKTGTCLRTLQGHTHYIYCLQVLPTSELVTGSGDKTVKLWNVETGTCLRTLQGHTHFIICLQVLSTGELATGSADKTVKLWNVKNWYMSQKPSTDILIVFTASKCYP